MNNQMLNFAQQLVKTNQNNIPDAPWRDAAINAILSGDAQAGQQMAQNSMSYNEYRKAKRHYTETKSPSDKQMMDEKSRRHIHEALDTFKDIWKDADPAMRKELKASMQQAINEMPA